MCLCVSLRPLCLHTRSLFFLLNNSYLLFATQVTLIYVRIVKGSNIFDKSRAPTLYPWPLIPGGPSEATAIHSPVVPSAPCSSLVLSSFSLFPSPSGFFFCLSVVSKTLPEARFGEEGGCGQIPWAVQGASPGSAGRELEEHMGVSETQQNCICL